MSQLSQLKAQINQVATNISQTATQMNTYSRNLQNQIGQVSNAIGGTATNEDKDMVAALQLVQKSVQDAAVQLMQAATKAKEWVTKA